MHVFICENTPNGILTGVYDAWELKIQERCSHADIYLVSGQPDNYELFCDYHTVAPSAEKAGKVVSTLNRKLGHDFYETKLIFAVRNPVTEKVEIENDTIKSKRGDHHGIGLLNVKAVVDKYGGDMVLSCDENEFKAVVIL